VILPALMDDVRSTQDNYAKFMRALEMLLTRRRTGLLPRRVNLFTTNYDLFIEDAAVKNNNVILNDGFRQRADIYNRIDPWWHWLLERENPRTLQVCT
ncbi:hypothetical protein SK430_26500, partial [Escherichia coli]|nr:hypothetical protein [Escherichia coli]